MAHRDQTSKQPRTITLTRTQMERVVADVQDAYDKARRQYSAGHYTPEGLINYEILLRALRDQVPDCHAVYYSE